LTHRRRATTLVCALAAVVPTGCSTEVDPDLASEATSVATTSELRVEGSTADVLDRLLDEAAGLSEAIVDNEQQRQVIRRIDVLWEAARPAVEESAPDSVQDFDRTIALMHTGVDRRRPADADKAYTNLTNLIATLPEG
jgi:hypothetical protein